MAEEAAGGRQGARLSMAKLMGVDTYLGPEMKSTGEVMGIDTSLAPRLTKALQAARLMLPHSGGILISVSDREKAEVVPIARRLAAHGYEVYATEGTATVLRAVGIEVAGVPAKVSEGTEGEGTTTDLIRDGLVHAVVNTMSGNRVPLRDGFEIRRARHRAGHPLLHEPGHVPRCR